MVDSVRGVVEIPGAPAVTPLRDVGIRRRYAAIGRVAGVDRTVVKTYDRGELSLRVAAVNVQGVPNRWSGGGEDRSGDVCVVEEGGRGGMSRVRRIPRDIAGAAPRTSAPIVEHSGTPSHMIDIGRLRDNAHAWCSAAVIRRCQPRFPVVL